MLKKKLIAAGILSIGALALSAPAMSAGFGNLNYSGRYACHEDDGTGSTSVETNFTASVGEGVGGLTTAYVVNPKGNGYYYSGDLVLNDSALFGNNPCTFSLNTGTSSYYVDSSGVVHEYQNWYDGNNDYCDGDSFYHEVEGSLVFVTQGAATETKTTANTDLYDLDYVGSGDCVLSGG